MIFNTLAPDYTGPLERDEHLKVQDARVDAFFKKEGMERPVINTSDVGSTVIDGQGGTFIQTVQAKIREGVSKIELQPMPGGQTPNQGLEVYGKDRTQEIKEMAKAAGVEITSVHAHPSLVGNLSGLGQNGFSEENRTREINEVKRALDFAADVSDGAGVVVHTGEFPRSIWDRYPEFEAYEGEHKDAIHHLVNKKTGEVIKSVKENEEIFVPEIDKEHPYELDENGNKIIDEFGEPVRRWKVDEKSKSIKVNRMTFSEYVEKEKNENPEIKELYAKDRELAKRKIVAEFFKQQQQAELSHQIGQMRQYEDMYVDGRKRREKIINAINEIKKIKENMPEEDRWRLQQVIRDRQDISGLIPPDVKDSEEYLRDMLSENERQMAYGREITLSGRRQAKRLHDMITNVEHIEDYAKEKSIESLSNLGIYAMKQTKERGLKNPMRILSENMLPEMGYGSHPKELRELVLGARKRMAEKLQAQGYAANEAKKKAATHIRALFDTAHLGAWWKNFKKDPNKTMEENRKKFNEWYMENVKMLEKDDIITNVHIADSTGYGDGHLAPGQGTLPVTEAVSYLHKKYKDSGRDLHINSEAYADPGKILTGVWEAFGSPIYAVNRPPVPKGSFFSDIHESYYGQIQSPYFVYGEYSPSDEWAPWSGTRME